MYFLSLVRYVSINVVKQLQCRHPLSISLLVLGRRNCLLTEYAFSLRGVTITVVSGHRQSSRQHQPC